MRTIVDDIKLVGRIAAVPTILEVVARTTGLRFAAVARVTDTHWTACAVHDLIEFGLVAGGELALESTICNEIRQHRQPVVFGHASADPRFADHPTPQQYGFESYISIPIIRADGEFFGTLCALDPRPAVLDDPNMLKSLELFAQLIAAQLDIEDRLTRSEHELDDALEVNRLRERFIAVLGHDLRSPLNAIQLGVDLLRDAALSERAARTLMLIRGSSLRMTELMENLLDFAHGKLGSGIPTLLQRATDTQLLIDALNQVVSEARVTHPGHEIELDVAVSQPITCDRHRLAQLLSNLLSNALSHGEPDQTVRIRVRGDASQFELSVHNHGAIAQELLPKLFQPFVRGHRAVSKHGLGLGLYIAAEIAKAHGGRLEASSCASDGTLIALIMPTGR